MTDFDKIGAPYTREHYVGRTQEQIVNDLRAVSDQPGLNTVYDTLAEHLADRILTPQDAVGTIIYDVTRHTSDLPLIIQSVAHTLVPEWLHELFGDSPRFEAAARHFYNHVVLGVAGVRYFGHPHSD